MTTTAPPAPDALGRTTTLASLRSEAVQIIREVVAEFDRPALLFKIGRAHV